MTVLPQTRGASKDYKTYRILELGRNRLPVGLGLDLFLYCYDPFMSGI